MDRSRRPDAHGRRAFVALFRLEHDDVDGGLADILRGVWLSVGSDADGARCAGRGSLGAILIVKFEGAALNVINRRALARCHRCRLAWLQLVFGEGQLFIFGECLDHS